MKPSPLALFGLALLALNGCGNADRGVELKNRVGTATHITVSPSGGTSSSLFTFGPCQNLQVFSSGSQFNGAKACRSTDNPRVVRLQVSAQFPANARVCVFPLSSWGYQAESCFALNGQTQSYLSSDQFESIGVVFESDAAAYKRYLNGQTSSYPDLGFTSLPR